VGRAGQADLLPKVVDLVHPQAVRVDLHRVADKANLHAEADNLQRAKVDLLRAVDSASLPRVVDKAKVGQADLRRVDSGRAVRGDKVKDRG
jgi:hypothetical protein